MNDEEKQAYLEKYRQAKKKGVPFFPNILFKDAVAALLVFVLLVALAYFVGAPLEERANPADTSYTPRPEWYFLFLFQLLKYFPGELEVVAVVVIPTVAIIALFLLPFLDRSHWRYFTKRPVITGITALLAVSVVVLTVQSIQEAPPPAEASTGDQTAVLYTENCSGCHGSDVPASAGANLHAIIAQGKHEDMPAWTADLTTDEIDALAGFILSPAGSELFTEQCSACHEAPELVAGDPGELKQALELGPGFPAHSEVDIPDWNESLTGEERTALLNFLIAPDGQRLYATNCSSCHGRSVGFIGEEEELRAIIIEGGLHLEMPPWHEKLTSSEIDRLALYVVKPSESNAGLFEKHCVRCHGERIPALEDFSEAREIIATGGAHETMPIWGDALTEEQLDALVSYTLSAAEGAPLEEGQLLFAENCADCHGDLGEGGENPARPNDIIAPISTAEYLKTRDDFTLRSIIAQGQPNFGMSPFGAAFGGPLDDDQVDALVTYMRSWQDNPPVELPPEVAVNTVALSGFDIFAEICAQCHGFTGGGDVGPSLRDANFRNTNSSQDIFDTISQGHAATDMIAWGAILGSEQIQQLVNFIEQLPIDESAPEPAADASIEGDADAEEEAGAEAPEAEPEPTPEPEESDEISFAANIFPILDNRCIDCHGTDGGWDATTYELFMTTGDHSPVVIPGDAEGSLLAQKLLGTHEEGDLMPPPPLRKLPDEVIQVFLDWIADGALDN
jgi:mono/diheme cytochrome c family protein